MGHFTWDFDVERLLEDAATIEVQVAALFLDLSHDLTVDPVPRGSALFVREIQGFQEEEQDLKKFLNFSMQPFSHF